MTDEETPPASAAEASTPAHPSPAAPVPAPVAPQAEAPAPEPDPLDALRADKERLDLEVKTLTDHRARIEEENTALQKALDAERARPSQEQLLQAVAGLQAEVAALTKERDALKAVAPPAAPASPVDLSEAAHLRIKASFLEALAEHSIAQVAPEAELPSNPFINRAE